MRVLLHGSSAGIDSDELLRALVSGVLVVLAALPSWKDSARKAR